MKIRVKFVYGWMKLQKKPPLCEILATQLIELLLQYFAFLAPLPDYGYVIVNCI